MSVGFTPLAIQGYLPHVQRLAEAACKELVERSGNGKHAVLGRDMVSIGQMRCVSFINYQQSSNRISLIVMG